MILTCPACSAQYVLPDNAIGAKGRRVKCTTCDYTWLQKSETIEPEKPVFVVDIEPNEISAPPKPRITPVVEQKSGFAKTLITGLGMAAVFLLITLGFAIGMRKDIVARQPASALLFEKIGFPVDAPGKGLEFDAVSAQITTPDAAKPLLNIKGKLSNNTKNNIFLPQMLIRLNGPNGWLKDWPVNLYGKVAQSGTTSNFTYDLKDLPANGKSVTLLFAD
jgi:predicted Zn finger-like uncharacterized protein